MIEIHKFLIQSIDGKVKHDFSFSLIESIDYNNWFSNDGDVYEYCLTDDFSKLGTFRKDNLTPVGTVEFVQKYVSAFHEIHSIKPINIPEELFTFKYLRRKCEILNKNEIILNKTLKFVKATDKIKSFTDFVEQEKYIPEGTFIVSDNIEIASEWRAFVFDGKLVGLNNYLGDFTIFPDVGFIEDMIKTYKECPPAYTLDVGINDIDGTFIIESHNFFSCGLYGFNDMKLLPKMFIRSFNYLINNGK